MQILVAGATGFIGIEVVRRLNEEGVRPRVMVRREARAPLLAPLDVEPVHGDLLPLPSVRRAVEGIDTVIHPCGPSHVRTGPCTGQSEKSFAKAMIAAAWTRCSAPAARL